MQDLERDRSRMTSSKPKFDEAKLLPEQRKALEIARAQGVQPIQSIDELRLDVDQGELEQFADALDEQRKKARLRVIKK